MSGEAAASGEASREASREAWADARLAARLLAADPHGLGGVRLRARPGPVRDAWLAELQRALGPDRPWRRMPPGIADDRLIGGLDLPATLAAGRPVAQRGLLAESDGGILVVPMAERLAPGTAARLAGALDTGTVTVARDGLAETRPARIALVLLDEGEGDEAVPAALADRVAFEVWLDGLSLRDLSEEGDATPAVADPASRPDAVALLCGVASALGVGTLRAPLLAVRAARCAAARIGADHPGETEIAAAARLVLAPRATRLPEPAAEPESRPDDAAEAAPPQPDDAADGTHDTIPEDVLIEAARAAIPPGLLARLLAGQGPAARRSGRGGAEAPSARSGRPAGTRRGDPRRARIALLDTLRAAAPWQRLRGQQHPGTGSGSRPGRFSVRAEDIRVTRLREKAETTTIFAVDASGSAAAERLAEAKGAVELLLADAYVRRDRVALVAFRGTSADLLLPPTRSLVRAKRSLAGLPGGGGTPLAAGIEAATGLGLAVRRGGGSPVLVLLTDGRANVARSGTPGRAAAGADALAAARALRVAGLPAILIDTAGRPQDAARHLAEAMAARYLALPHAQSSEVGAAVRALAH